MRNKFHSYFKLTDVELKEFLENGFVSYDANVLLKGYRCSLETRETLLNVFEKFKNKTFMTHQATAEFFKNRSEVILGQVAECDKILKDFRDYFKKSHNQSLFTGDVSVNMKAIEDHLEEKKKEFEAMISNDPYLNQIANIFSDVVSDEFSDNDLEEIYLKAQKRFEDKIPPGYLDEKKAKPDCYGDYVIWCHLIGYAKLKENNMIFVCDEKKEDWWLKKNGRTISARPELLKEFYDVSQKKILIVSSESFLSMINEKKIMDIQPNVISEIDQYFGDDYANGVLYEKLTEERGVTHPDKMDKR